MKDALEIHAYFKSQPDSQHIATLGNVEAVVHWSRHNHPKAVLEMGAGIGTLTYAVLANSEARVDLYEDSTDICVPRLKENLKPFEGRYVIYEDYTRLPARREYDLVIVDGGAGKGNQGGFVGATFMIVSYLERIGVLFVEGNRMGQRSEILEALRLRYSVKQKTVSSGSGKGGAFFIPTSERSWLVRQFSYLINKIGLALTVRSLS